MPLDFAFVREIWKIIAGVPAVILLEFQMMRDLRRYQFAFSNRPKKHNSPLGSRADEMRIEALFASPSVLLEHSPALPRKCRIDQILATEILSSVFELLDDLASIKSVRHVCRTFEQAAWPAFAKYFEHQVFHPTVESLGYLRNLAQNEAAAPYLKKLKISTMKPLMTPEITPADAISDYFSDDGHLRVWKDEKCLRVSLMHTLRDAFTKLKNLEAIYIVDGDELTPFQVSPTQVDGPEGLTYLPTRTVKVGLKLFDKKAHRHTLDVVYGALSTLKPGQEEESFLPKLRTFITGRMSVSSLPELPHRESDGLSLWDRFSYSRMVHLTHLDLAITDDPALCFLEQRHRLKEMAGYLPDFLACTPNLTDLTLHFPRFTILKDRGFSASRLLYGNIGFTPIADSVCLPRLANLHLVNLGLDPDTPLRRFLFRHRQGLTQVKFTTLALCFVDWCPFMEWLGESMELQWLVLASNLTREEEKLNQARWEHTPDAFEPKAEHYQKAAKMGTKCVLRSGEVRVIKGKEHSNNGS